MTKWRAYGIVTGSKFLGEFEASTEAQAIQLAAESGSAYVSLCHQCANECDDAQIFEIEVEKVE